MTERMENALRHIKTSVDVDPWAVEEVERVFKAYEQTQPQDGDGAVSLNAVLDTIHKTIFEQMDTTNDVEITYEETLLLTVNKEICNRIKQLPSVTQPCEDAISRQALKNILVARHAFYVNAYNGFKNLPQPEKARVDEISSLIAEVVNAPSVTPNKPSRVADGIKYCEDCDHVELCAFEGTTIECVWKSKPKTGQWIDDGYYADNSNKSVWRCSKCDHHIIEYDMEGYKFCPNCGANMRGNKDE